MTILFTVTVRLEKWMEKITEIKILFFEISFDFSFVSFEVEMKNNEKKCKIKWKKKHV